MSSEHPGIRELEREWKISLFVVIGGFALAIALAAFLTFGKRPHAVVPDQTAVEESVPPPEETALGDVSHLCRTALANAMETGAIPKKSRLSDRDPRLTDQTNRLVCDATAEEKSYSIAVDVVCEDTQRAECVSVYGIAQDDGEVLYQRRN